MATTTRNRLPWVAYAEDVAAQRIPAGKLARLACERSLRDLAHFGTKPSARRPYYFDAEHGERCCDFFPRFLVHSKGEWAGRPFDLELWQRWQIANLFGWKECGSGHRRYRKSYLEIPRKNGKSQLCAGVGTICLAADGESGAEVYSAATKKDQAKITWLEGKKMVGASRELRGAISVFANALTVEGSTSKWEPISSDEQTADGLNPSAVLVDELHAHRNRGLLDKLETAMGARRQPLLVMITTAGYGGHSVCWEMHEYGRKVLEGMVDDPSFLAYVASIDPGDDWRDESSWRKANPNLGVSVKLSYLEREAAQALEIPSKQNAFRRLHLNDWTEQAERWLDLEKWDACGESFELGEVEDAQLIVGVDLATSSDFCAAVAVAPPEEGREAWAVFPRFWIPEEKLHARVRDLGVPVDAWAEAGYVETVPGNMVTPDSIEEALREWREGNGIAEVAIDPWNAGGLGASLEEHGVKVAMYGQGWKSASPAMRALERCVLTRTLAHGGNPVLRWMAGNLAVEMDAAGNVKWSRKRSRDKIDGLVALAMALARGELLNSANGGGGLYDGDGDDVFVL